MTRDLDMETSGLRRLSIREGDLFWNPWTQTQEGLDPQSERVQHRLPENGCDRDVCEEFILGADTYRSASTTTSL